MTVNKQSIDDETIIEKSSCMADDFFATVWSEMSKRFEQGDSVRAEHYFRLNMSRESAVDLIYAEYLLKREYGLNVSSNEYYDRFPEYSDLLRRQFAFDDAISTVNLPTQTALSETVKKSSETTSVGKYVTLVLLASGGQADVYRAIHPELRCEVVVKLARESILEADACQMASEGRILADLDHPNISKVMDFGEHNGRAYLVSRYIPGRTLNNYVVEESLSPAEFTVIVAKIANALNFVHRRGVTHLDVKPQNIVVDDNGTPFLVDFGLSVERGSFQSSSSNAGGLCGTLSYMSPEQARVDQSKIGPKCDVFSLGAVLYQLTVGKAPYEDEPLPALLEKIQYGSYDKDSLECEGVPSSLKKVIRKAMQKNPKDRYRTCDEMAAELEKFSRWHRIRKQLQISLVLVLFIPIVLTAWQIRLLTISSHEKELTTNYHSYPSQASPNASLRQSLKLAVGVHHNNRYIDVTERVPLVNGDVLQIVAEIPAEHFVTLFTLNRLGEVQELCRKKPSKESYIIRYPDDSTEGVPLVGIQGTEIFILCVNRESPIKADAIRHAVESNSPIPDLPELAVLASELEGVTLKQDSRGLGAPQKALDSQATVIQILKDINTTITNEGGLSESVAFFHAN